MVFLGPESPDPHAGAAGELTDGEDTWGAFEFWVGRPHDMEVMMSSVAGGAGEGTALLARSSAIACFRASAALASASWISRKDGPEGVLTSLSSLTAHGAGLGVLEDRSGVATAVTGVGSSAIDAFRDDAGLIEAGADALGAAGLDGVCSLASDDRREAATAPQAETGAGAAVGSGMMSADSATSSAEISGLAVSCETASTSGCFSSG